MGKIILICGKICSGKTHYCRELLKEHPAVPLSCDELMGALFHHQEGERFDEIAADAKAYLHRKAMDIAQAGADVLLDWGFWTAQERKEVSDMYRRQGIEYEWHYISVSEARWRAQIVRRNEAVQRGESSDYYVDEGLLQKLESRFEVPQQDEMDIWHINE